VDSFVFGGLRWRANWLVLDVKPTSQAGSNAGMATVLPSINCKLVATVSAVLALRFSPARYCYGDSTSSTGRGDPAIVASSQAKWLSFDHRPSSGCLTDSLPVLRPQSEGMQPLRGKFVATGAADATPIEGQCRATPISWRFPAKNSC
jgi:hypothetical protein